MCDYRKSLKFNLISGQVRSGQVWGHTPEQRVPASTLRRYSFVLCQIRTSRSSLPPGSIASGLAKETDARWTAPLHRSHDACRHPDLGCSGVGGRTPEPILGCLEKMIIVGSIDVIQMIEADIQPYLLLLACWRLFL